jgi:hypothetical protein
MVERAVRQDSGAWLMNRYDRGSISNVRVAERTGGSTTLRAEYTYNGGSSGWVLARVVEGRVDCLGYWDMGGCTSIRSGPYPTSRYDWLQRCYHVASVGAVMGRTGRIKDVWHDHSRSLSEQFWREARQVGMTDDQIRQAISDRSRDPDYISDTGVWADHVMACQRQGLIPSTDDLEAAGGPF